LHRAALVLLAASLGCATSAEEHTTFVEKLSQWRGRDVGELFHAVGKPMRTYEAANGNPVVVYEIRTVAGGTPYYPTASNEIRLCRVEFEVDRQDQRVLDARPSGDGCP
jgi:hypothetical protein